MVNEDFQSVFHVFPYCPRCSKMVFGPPFSCFLDLALGASLDAVGKRHD